MTQDTEKPTRSWSQLEIDNAYLKQQNELLNKELSFTRYTIQALKTISLQKETSLSETRQELERALHHIQLLKKRNSLLNPTLIQDNDLSDDLSEEEVVVSIDTMEKRHIDMMEKRPIDMIEKRPIDIMAKLPLRKQVFVNQMDF